MGYIYGLYHKTPDALLYVGQTKNTLEQRLSQHKLQPNGLMKNYIIANGYQDLHIDVIEEVDDHLLNETEMFWIEILEPMFNTTGLGKARLLTSRHRRYQRR